MITAALASRIVPWCSASARPIAPREARASRKRSRARSPLPHRSRRQPEGPLAGRAARKATRSARSDGDGEANNDSIQERERHCFQSSPEQFRRFGLGLSTGLADVVQQAVVQLSQRRTLMLPRGGERAPVACPLHPGEIGNARYGPLAVRCGCPRRHADPRAHNTIIVVHRSPHLRFFPNGAWRAAPGGRGLGRSSSVLKSGILERLRLIPGSRNFFCPIAIREAVRGPRTTAAAGAIGYQLGPRMSGIGAMLPEGLRLTNDRLASSSEPSRPPRRALSV